MVIITSWESVDLSELEGFIKPCSSKGLGGSLRKSKRMSSGAS